MLRIGWDVCLAEGDESRLTQRLAADVPPDGRIALQLLLLTKPRECPHQEHSGRRSACVPNYSANAPQPSTFPFSYSNSQHSYQAKTFSMVCKYPNKKTSLSDSQLACVVASVNISVLNGKF